MADPTPDPTTGQPPADPTGATPLEPAAEPPKEDADGLKRALNSERQLRAAAEKAKSAAEKRIQEFEDAQKSDLEKVTARAEAAEKKAADLERSVLRSRVAAKHDLPAELADRLQGDDEAALDEDAKRLAALVTPMGDMGARRGGGNGGAGGSADDMNAQIRAKAGR